MIIKLKWGMEYKGTSIVLVLGLTQSSVFTFERQLKHASFLLAGYLVSVDSYMNLQVTIIFYIILLTVNKLPEDLS